MYTEPYEGIVYSLRHRTHATTIRNCEALKRRGIETPEPRRLFCDRGLTWLTEPLAASAGNTSGV